jgi:hypothetical protein
MSDGTQAERLAGVIFFSMSLNRLPRRLWVVKMIDCYASTYFQAD